MKRTSRLKADFIKNNNNIIVDFKFKKRKGCLWNPLNLIGSRKNSRENDGSASPSERDELMKRVRYLEKHLLMISKTINRCEQNKQNNEEVDKEDTEGDITLDNHHRDIKDNEAHTVLLRQMMSHSKERKFMIRRNHRKEISNKKRKLTDRLSTYERQFKPRYEHCVARVEQNTTDLSNKWYNILEAEMAVAEKSTTEQSKAKRYLKTVIEEAVVDSIGKGLNKYFKVGLDSYIKQRVDSAIRAMKNNKTNSWTTLYASYTSHHPRKLNESNLTMKELTKEKKQEIRLLEDTKNNSILTSETSPPKIIPSKTKFISRAFKYRNHTGQRLRRSGIEPSSTTSYVRDILGTSKQMFIRQNPKPLLHKEI